MSWAYAFVTDRHFRVKRKELDGTPGESTGVTASVGHRAKVRKTRNINRGRVTNRSALRKNTHVEFQSKNRSAARNQRD